MGIPTSGAAFHPPDGFGWDGRICRDLSPGQYRLLQALTDGDTLRDFVPFTDLAEVVWPDRPPRDIVQAVRQLARRTGDKLHAARVRLFLEREGFAYRLIPF
jgi:hypothetical protein